MRKIREALHGAEITADITTTAPDIVNAQDSLDTTLKLDKFEAADGNDILLAEAKERFIQEQLEKRRAETQSIQKTDTSGPTPAPPKPHGPSPPSRLLTDTDVLKSVAGAAAAPVDVDASERGERWLTGIAEVSLPISHKLANIERTEKAREELLRKKEARIREMLEEDGDVKFGGVNYNANYRKHKRDWDEQAKTASALERYSKEKAEAEKTGAAVPPPPTTTQANSQSSADPQKRYEQAMERVRQNMSKPSHDMKIVQDFKKHDKRP